MICMFHIANTRGQKRARLSQPWLSSWAEKIPSFECKKTSAWCSHWGLEAFVSSCCTCASVESPFLLTYTGHLTKWFLGFQ